MTCILICAGVACVAAVLGWIGCAVVAMGSEGDEEFTPHRVPENVTTPGDRA